MKILIWCPHVSLGGGIRLLQQLAPAIARHPEVESVRLAVAADEIENVGGVFPGLEIFELSGGREDGLLRSWLKADGRVLGVRGTERLKASVRYRLLAPLDRRREGPRQREQLEQAARGCDVVYCFWPQRLACPRLDLPLACTYQDTTLIDFPEILGGDEAKRLKDLSEGWVERSTVVVSSEATRDNLVRLFGPRAGSARVIHHAILPDGGGSLDRHTSLADSLPRDYVVFPAHTTTSKNHHALLEAWARFGRRRESALVFFGAGTERMNRQPHEPEVAHDWHLLRLLGQIARHGLRPGEDFHALGYVDDDNVLSLVAGAKALVMPTLAEGGGSYPVEEALAVGTPVLCSDIPVMREHLRGRSARVGWFDPYSVDSIVRALEELFDDYGEYKESAVRGARDPRPTWDDVAAQYVEVFKGMRS